jgi:hypothetical protein
MASTPSNAEIREDETVASVDAVSSLMKTEAAHVAPAAGKVALITGITGQVS